MFSSILYFFSLAVSLCLPAMSWAQGQPTAPADGPGTPSAIPTVRPMALEAIIVMLMIGAALFVVCKSSRRN